LKVGIVWAGAPIHRRDRERSIPIDFLAPLLALENIHWVSLQKGDRAQEALRMTSLRMTHLSSHLHDFADTAAAIANLDLVISIDTSVCHLAGALGKPTWTLLPFSPDWRWLLGRDDSPWYPSMTLYRQPTPGDWPAVLFKVAADLTSFKSAT
jgi:hypothetical protein